MITSRGGGSEPTERATRSALAATGLAVLSVAAAAVGWFLADDNRALWWVSAASGAFAMAAGCSVGLRGQPIGWLAVALSVPGVGALLVMFTRSVAALVARPTTALPELVFSMLTIGGATAALHQWLRR